MNRLNFRLVILLLSDITSLSCGFINISPVLHQQESSSPSSSWILFSNDGSPSSSSSTNNENNNENIRKNENNDNNNKKKPNNNNNSNGNNQTNKKEIKSIMKRIIQLERLVSHQSVEISRLRQECQDLKEAAQTFASVVELLRQAGFSSPSDTATSSSSTGTISSSSSGESNDNKDIGAANTSPSYSSSKMIKNESEIFGNPPSSVIDAADVTGSSILAAVLAGKMRMLVDVRDAELTRDYDMLAQFIELAILPVAAGLEGLNSNRNRVKIIFPTVSLLLQYRKSMSLTAPEVIALSTLGFDAVEEKDNLVIIIAPSPDDVEGNELMTTLLNLNTIRQPVVLLNYHMVPVNEEIVSNFEVVYHLRLLSVHYMTGDAYDPEYTNVAADEDKVNNNSSNRTATSIKPSTSTSLSTNITNNNNNNEEDDDLSAAMEHAHELGFNHGITRAMVIRSYPRPWHVFVDTSPDIDADFEIAAIFENEPSQEEVNYSIIECLEGSEKEDELVAQQMQKALEAGQLSKVSKMLGINYDYQPRIFNETDDDDDIDDDYYDFWKGDEDSC